MEQTTYKSLCYHTKASLQRDRLMQLQDTRRQLEDVEKRWMDTEKEEISINTYSMCGNVDKNRDSFRSLHGIT